MAYLRTKTNKVCKKYYYSIVKSVKWEKNMRIPLYADTLEEAEGKHQEVQDHERGLKNGQKYVWSWENPCGNKTRIVKKTINQIIENWLDIKKTNVAPESHRRYRVSLNAFLLTISPNSPISSINNQTIENFKKIFKGIHTDAGINLNLRGLKCFLRWCFEEGYLKAMPKIVMLKEPKRKPKLINEEMWNAIMSLDWLSDWWKNVFRLYKTTGMRRSETIYGTLRGNVLTVPAEHSKSRREYDIDLNDWQSTIVQKIQDARDEHLSKGSKMVTFKNKFTKIFSDACKMVCIYEKYRTTFHSLRHTFAVLMYYETRDIHDVFKALHHGRIETTLIYMDYSAKRIEKEFPSLVKKNGDDTRKVGTHSNNYAHPPL